MFYIFYIISPFPKKCVFLKVDSKRCDYVNIYVCDDVERVRWFCLLQMICNLVSLWLTIFSSFFFFSFFLQNTQKPKPYKNSLNLKLFFFISFFFLLPLLLKSVIFKQGKTFLLILFLLFFHQTNSWVMYSNWYGCICLQSRRNRIEHFFVWFFFFFLNTKNWKKI